MRYWIFINWKNKYFICKQGGQWKKTPTINIPASIVGFEWQISIPTWNFIFCIIVFSCLISLKQWHLTSVKRNDNIEDYVSMITLLEWVGQEQEFGPILKLVGLINFLIANHIQTRSFIEPSQLFDLYFIATLYYTWLQFCKKSRFVSFSLYLYFGTKPVKGNTTTKIKIVGDDIIK